MSENLGTRTSTIAPDTLHLEPVYAVYFNEPNYRVRIHKIDFCDYPKSDRDSSVNDGWGFFMEEYAAETFAVAVSESKKLHDLNDCHVCKRNGWQGLLRRRDDFREDRA